MYVYSYGGTRHSIRGGAGVRKKRRVRLDLQAFVAGNGDGRAIVELRESTALFSQGDLADRVFYILKGQVKLAVMSAQGKEAVIAVLGPDAFVGEGCLAGTRLRMATAKAMTDGTAVRLKKEGMIRLLHEQPDFA